MLALPAVAVVLVLRYILREVFDIGEVATFSEVGSVITGVTLILGFMLGGVLSDYKESEKLPASVAVALSGFRSTAHSGLLAKDLDVSMINTRISKVATAIGGWFVGANTEEYMWNSLSDFPALIVDLEKAGMASHYVGRLMVLNGEINATLNRVAVFRSIWICIDVDFGSGVARVSCNCQFSIIDHVVDCAFSSEPCLRLLVATGARSRQSIWPRRE